MGHAALGGRERGVQIEVPKGYGISARGPFRLRGWPRRRSCASRRSRARSHVPFPAAADSATRSLDCGRRITTCGRGGLKPNVGISPCESALSLQRRVVAPGEPLRDHRTLGHELSRSRSSGEPHVDDALLVDGDSLWSQQRERHVVRAVRRAQHVKGPVDGWCVGGSRGLVDGGDNRLHGTALTAREFRRLLSVGRQGGGQAQKRGDSDDGDASHLTYLVITG
jgi:hypothetical protein